MTDKRDFGLEPPEHPLTPEERRLQPPTTLCNSLSQQLMLEGVLNFGDQLHS